MRRILISWRVTLAACAALAIAACGGGGGDAPSEPSGAPIQAPATPLPAQPGPQAPQPTEPIPTEPAPIAPTPVAPMPITPAPIEPAPPASSPVTPTPIEPAPVPVPHEPAPSEPGRTEPQPPPITSTQDAMRLLEQATFGPTEQDRQRVMQLGIAAYVDAQLTMTKTGYVGFTRTAYVQPDDCKTQPNNMNSAASLCARTHYTLFEVQRQFYANALNGDDQLRQRVAFALSQIFVVAGTKVQMAAGMADYQNMLLDGAFGNFRDLLEQVTLHPMMGSYLDMVNNVKGIADRGTRPNENYARELLQLFAIGTHRLNIDGTTVNDAYGQPLPAYSEADVAALARVFTGWTYSPWVESRSRWVNPPKFVGAMVPFDAQHDSDEKRLLGATLSANQSARADLQQALDVIFEHANVGPFIALRMIQHLVTSNPSPAYIARVARVFENNGAGVRGDMRAVVRAILHDPEARGASKTDSSYGKLKEPALFMTGFVRSLGGQSDGLYLRAQSAALGQNIFMAPSVFNYYSPLNRISDGALYGPEFALFDGATALERIDFVYQLVYAGGAAPDPTVPGSIGTSIEFGTSGLRHAGVTELESRLMFGKLSSASSDALSTAIQQLPVDDAESRARAAAYALGISAQYQIQR